MENLDECVKMLDETMHLVWTHTPKPNPQMSFDRGECRILFNLDRNSQGMSPSQLADRLSVGSGRIGNALKDLEAKGLIRREVSPKDRRRAIVKLTDKGRAETDRMKAGYLAIVRKLVDRMGYEKFKTMNELIRMAIAVCAKEDSQC